MVLERIVEDKRKDLAEQKTNTPISQLEKMVDEAPPVRDFTAAISKPVINVIAEVKKASPSRGVIKEDFDVTYIAKCYERGGASAVSVLTEKTHFKGDLSYMLRVREATSLPVLRKDFIFDVYQVYESRAYGADAILLIVAILEPQALHQLHLLARRLGLSVLVEVHNREEAIKALALNARIIGINNRDLKTFEVDIATTINLVKYIPADKIIVSESGISVFEQVRFLYNLGVKAILVGESLLRSDDIERKLRELKGLN